MSGVEPGGGLPSPEASAATHFDLDQSGRRLTWLPVALWAGPQAPGFRLGVYYRFTVCLRMQWFPPGSSVHLIGDHPETVDIINLGPDGRRAWRRGGGCGELPPPSNPNIWRQLDRILEERSQTLTAGPPETELDYARFAREVIRRCVTRHLQRVKITSDVP